MNIVKLMCHCCKKFTSSEFLVPCKIPGCKLLFCHKCLTSRFKYSHAKTATLPTAHWKCPVCANRCRCEVCIEKEVVVLNEKKPLRPNSTVPHSHRKKRIRKDKRNHCDAPTKPEQLMRCSISEKETHEICSPIPRRFLPPISSIVSCQN